jgi:hypothetical protein
MNVLKAHGCQKRPNLHTNELNTTFFCSTSPLKAPNRLKPLKLSNIHLFSVGLLGFVGFIVNLLNRPNRRTDGATVHDQKSASEKELLLVRMGVRKNTFFIIKGP